MKLDLVGSQLFERGDLVVLAAEEVALAEELVIGGIIWHSINLVLSILSGLISSFSL